jgi:8-oxo-dGTP pyrophosphatase MutT (NUDIX family)
MPKIKDSYGIICCRPSKDGTQLLMIKKSTTYHFSEFIHGKYTKHDNTHLIRLFNNMTYHEKTDILTLNFQTMWYRIYRMNPSQYEHNRNNRMLSVYYDKKSKFETTFLHDGGTRLKKLIDQSTNGETPWEFPKGRKNNIHEHTLDTAIREFTEETGIEKSKYRILWRVLPYIECYKDFGTTYRNTYYIAEAIGEWEPIYNFTNNTMVNEVSSIKWVCKQHLRFMDLDSVSYMRVNKSIKKIIKKYKTRYKSQFKLHKPKKTIRLRPQYLDIDLKK